MEGEGPERDRIEELIQDLQRRKYPDWLTEDGKPVIDEESDLAASEPVVVDSLQHN